MVWRFWLAEDRQEEWVWSFQINLQHYVMQLCRMCGMFHTSTRHADEMPLVVAELLQLLDEDRPLASLHAMIDRNSSSRRGAAVDALSILMLRTRELDLGRAQRAFCTNGAQGQETSAASAIGSHRTAERT